MAPTGQQRDTALTRPEDVNRGTAEQPANALSTYVPEIQGTLLHIFVSPGHDYWGSQGAGRLQHGIREVAEAECVAGRGLRGDRYFHSKPGHKGQVTFFEAGVVEEIRKEFKLPKLPASVFRRNLIVEGVRLKEWLGRQFLFQGILFEGAQECKPCHWMSRVVNDGTEEFMKKEFRGGLRAKILSDGTLRSQRL